MRRRDFLHAGGALALGAGTWARPLGAAGILRVPTADLILRRAFVVDGTGRPGFEADVSVTGGRIEAIGSIAARGAEEIDLAGHVLAPGFIDIHSHADLQLLVNPKAESRIRQGVTLEVAGQDGSSVGPWSEADRVERDSSYQSAYGVPIDFRTIGGFLDRIDRVRPAVNVATMVGTGTVRGQTVGFRDRPANEREIRMMRGLVRAALEQGAVGLSSGLEYVPGTFADTAELIELARELAGSGYAYASHMRNEDDELLAATEEALRVGRAAGVPVQVSHLKAQGERNWWKAATVLALIEEARESGLDVHFDRYPYVAYSTGLSNLFPSALRGGSNSTFVSRLVDPETAPALERAARDKIAQLGSWNAVQIVSTNSARNRSMNGRRLGDLAAESGVEPYALTVRLLTDGKGSVSMIGFGMSEENTERMLTHPLGMICSDGGAYAPYGALSGGSPHPRAYGTFPRVLGLYVRDRQAMPLEEAIRKMTSLPAAKLRIRDRGVLRPGAAADLVAFDPLVVADQATFDDPHQYPVGIPLVIVNGVVTLREGEHTGALAGVAVRGSGPGAPS